MQQKEKSAIDLYSGMGGWSLGMKLAGVKVVSSYEWWKDANRTHNKNFKTDHSERNIRELNLTDLPKPGTIDFVVGSPPCTQFSLANRGGGGDIADGLVDIKKFLEVVEYLKPKYWAMENVPRVAGILSDQIENGELTKFKHLFGDIRIFKASDFGVPQDRKRMIAGKLPFDLLESYTTVTPRSTLGKVINSLQKKTIKDPIYGITLPKFELTDHEFEANLTAEEARINREAKTHHPVYNKMSFPENLDRPSRTITAVCTRVSRESIIIANGPEAYRRLTVRERGVLQSFPINFQYFGSSYNSKIKMIGNAVPPLLTFYIAQAMNGIKKEQLKLPHQVAENLKLSDELAITSKPDAQTAKYSWNRGFRMAIGGLRFGSGVGFDLKNYFDKDSQETSWKINFNYGSSKNIKVKILDRVLFEKLSMLVESWDNPKLNNELLHFAEFVKTINPQELQKKWANLGKGSLSPFELIDEITLKKEIFKNVLLKIPRLSEILPFFEHEMQNKQGVLDNKKLLTYSLDIFIGLLLGSIFNIVIEGHPIDLLLPRRLAV